MKNLKISMKLIVGFGTILALFIVSVIFASVCLNSVASDLDLFYKKPFQNVPLAVQIDMNSEVAAKFMLRSCVEQDMGQTENFLNQAQENINKMSEQLATLKANYTGNTSEVAAVEQHVTKLNQAFTDLAAASRSNNITEAYRVYTTQIADLLLDITDSIGVVREHANQVATENHDTGMRSSRITMILMIALGVVALFVGVALALYITRSITRAVVELQNASQRMSKGDFDAKITYESRDELGELAGSMRELMGILKKVIQDISYLMGELSGGNLTVKTQARERYVGELQPILQSIEKMKDDLNSTMSGIATASDQVSAGAEQVSSGAQALAQGATQQASSVEELAATIDEISQHIAQTAQHAETAKTENMHAHDEIQVCSGHMSSLVDAMRVIADKSNEVSKVIKAIEDIAFQTNILALNAAVEAARAGSAGKGFAVVADEVRNLATKSQEAAKSTTTLIGEAIRAVEDGTKISGETEESLSRVVADAKAVLDAVINISEATTQQSESIKQISVGVDQISSVVQTNSATAEQSAAASEELSGQAEMLKNLVAVFRLEEDSVRPGGSPAAPAPAAHRPAAYGGDKY